MAKTDFSQLPIVIDSSPCGCLEFLGKWFKYFKRSTYKIDKKGVHFTSAKDTWFEPLSAYKNILLIEETENVGKYSATSVHFKTLNSSIELNQVDNPKHSVSLYKTQFGGRDKDIAICKQISELLGLPIQELIEPTLREACEASGIPYRDS